MQQRGNDKADLWDQAWSNVLTTPCVPEIAAAVDRRIGIEHFPPDAGKRHLDAIILIDFGREINDHEATVACFMPFAQPGEDAAVGIVHHQPLEPRCLAIELVQRR